MADAGRAVGLAGGPAAFAGSPSGADWTKALRAYLATTGAANLVWEAAHLPLYTIWRESTPSERFFAVVHCTGGDLLIALSALALSLTIVGERGWPARSFARVLAATVAAGVAYTVFSEWLNIVVRQSWAYSELMPVIPLVNTGVSPMLQWIVVPVAALYVARRAASRRPA